MNILVILVGALLFLRCQEIKQQKIIPPNLNVVTLSPDNISINGNSLSGELQSSEQNVRFSYQIKSLKEKKSWQELDHLIQAKVRVVQITPISGPRNIGEFDFRRYLSNRNIHYFAKISQIDQQHSVHPQTISGKINVLRIHIINYLNALPHWLRIHAQSLLVGYTSYSDKDFLKVLSVLGIIHLFSLSGLHVLILLTIVRKFTSFIRIPVEWVDTVLLFLLPAYGLLVGSKSGIWRAIVLAMIGILCQKFKIKLSKLDIFSLTMMVCLFIYPYAVLEMGGQLSFLLSFAILYLYRDSHFLSTAWKMNLTGLPLICFYTFQFNWLTLIVNVFFVPFFTYIILPTTIISFLSVHLWLWKSFDDCFGRLYGMLDSLAADHNFIFITGKFSVWLTILLVIVALFYVESKKTVNRYLKLYLGLFITCILFNKFPLYGSVHMLDVGQGDSIVITTPLNRKTFMIDVGGKLSFPVKPWAKRNSLNQVDTSSIPFLKSQGITQVDRLFLTHKDVDHIGNLEAFLNHFLVKQVNFGTGLENNPRIKLVKKQHPEIQFKSLKQGNLVDEGFLKWQVLWPKEKSIGENGDSLTLLTRMKNRKWLFTGDLDSDGEEKILKDHNFQVDFLKIGHHGSRTSTGDRWLDVLKPKFGFISAGINNRYGHPNKETIKRLEQHQVKYLNTADYGMISWYYYFFNSEERITTFLKGDLVENSGAKKESETR